MGVLTQGGESWTPLYETAERIFKWGDLKMNDKGTRFVGGSRGIFSQKILKSGGSKMAFSTFSMKYLKN